MCVAQFSSDAPIIEEIEIAGIGYGEKSLRGWLR